MYIHARTKGTRAMCTLPVSGVARVCNLLIMSRFAIWGGVKLNIVIDK